MLQPNHIAFFGASVTEQHVHHATGEVSGFVTYFERHLAEGLGVRVSRVSAGSGDLTDAALICVEDVIALKPDICILDWVTPALTTCDPLLVQQIYFRLLAHDILPVTVIFPRRDREQRELPITQEMSGLCQTYDLPFFDATPLMHEYGADVVLRDVVHTTPEGARIYAEAIADLIPRLPCKRHFAFAAKPPFVVTELLPAEPPTGSLRKIAEAVATLTPRFLSELGFSLATRPPGVMPAAQPPDSFRKITVTNLAKDNRPLEFTLVMQQRVGPFSPVLDVCIFNAKGSKRLPPFPLWDVWCNRERQTTKKIMNWHRGPFHRIEFNISRTDPDYASCPEAEPVEFAKRRIRQRGKLFLISDRPQPCSVSYA